MPPTLYIRDPQRCKAKKSPSPFEGFARVDSFPTYKEAVEHGQTLAGYGNFLVDLGETSFPSREQQLLIPPRSSRRRERELLAQLID